MGRFERRAVDATRLLVMLFTALGFALFPDRGARADEPWDSWMTQPTASIDGFFPTPWACGGAGPAPQSILDFHHNWHCSNPDHSGPNWGNRFFGFHKQFLLGFDRYGASLGFPHVQTWVAAPNAPIPLAHSGRPANAPCATCVALPGDFHLPTASGTLDTFATVAAIGDAIIGWHNTNHGRVAAAGGTGGCGPDMNCPAFSPRDPIFYRYHHIFDDVQDAWRTWQPTDLMVVFDRSGSMSLPTSGVGTRLDAAKSASAMLADLLEDGSAHRLGLVSFSSGASAVPELPLTSAAAAPAAMGAALPTLIAAGGTSIGAGLQAAMGTLSGSTNPRKAILLLTDGMENTSPLIADVVAALGDTHVCAVGFGTPGTLDGPKLRDLTERQGGIYISGPGALELRKFFVDCFADIFDSFVGADPVATLAPGSAASDPTVHMALGDDKLAFVLSWSEPTPVGTLRLQITSPSGRIVDLRSPGVESRFGENWHIVRFKLPQGGEGDGQWTARAVRGGRAFVNGFSPDAFADLFAGADLVRQQIRSLCPSGCNRVLYYEDEVPMTDTMLFEDHNSVYSEALYTEVPRRTVSEVTRVRDPGEFAERMAKGGFDLLVYASKLAEGRLPSDSLLQRVLCDPAGPPVIISDNRDPKLVERLLGCLGVQRTGDDNWTSFATDGAALTGKYELKGANGHAHVGLPFSVGLKTTGAPNAVIVASGGATGAPGAVVLGRVGGKEAQDFFINVLTRSSARVVPFRYAPRTYTGESLHPTFQIPEPYWPSAGFDTIRARVLVTRPLRSAGSIAAESGSSERGRIGGDALDPRQAAQIKADPGQTGDVIGSETLEFPLFDDGTHGDTTAGDHYWEAALPPKVAEFDGEYELHAIFELCRAAICVRREARDTTIVESKLSARSRVDVQRLPNAAGQSAQIRLTPIDEQGRLMGPGLAQRLLVNASPDVKVTSVRDLDGRGNYEILIDWTDPSIRPEVTVRQFGRPKDELRVVIP